MAAAVIERCAGKARVRALVAELADRYAAPREVIQGDVVKLLRGLAYNGVLTA